MLDAIKNTLEELSLPVYYGAADSLEEDVLWDYIVFSRDRTSRSANNKGYSDYFRIALVHENFIPVGLVENIVDKIEGIPGMRMAQSDVEYTYTRKDSTNAVVELAIMTFVCPRKRV